MFVHVYTWFYAALRSFDSLVTVPFGAKYVVMFTVILQCKYLKKSFVHFFGLVLRICC